MTRALSGEVCIGIPGRPPAACCIPAWGIIFIAIGFGGIAPLTGAPPGIPCMGRFWLTPTPAAMPLGTPFGAPFGNPGAPLGMPFGFLPGWLLIIGC